MSKATVLDYMIQNDLLDHKKYMVSHHLVENPQRIDIRTDEVVYIDKITINPSVSPFWLEFHSGIESRLIETENFEQVTRHKGNIYFSNSNIINYKVSYVKLKIINIK